MTTLCVARSGLTPGPHTNHSCEGGRGFKGLLADTPIRSTS